MPDWTSFSLAYANGLPRSAQLQALRKVEAWFDLSQPEALAALEKSIKSGDSARSLYQDTSILRLKLQREMGIPFAPEAQAKIQGIFAAVEKGSASEKERQFAMRLLLSWHLSHALLQIDPTLNQPLSPADQAKWELQKAMIPISERLNRHPGNTPGSVTPASIHELELILADFQNLAEKAGADNPALPDVFYSMGHAALSLAECCTAIGRNEDAARYFEKSADSFARAGHPEKADDARAKARSFDQRRSGSLDDSAADNLKVLVDSKHAPDALSRIASLVNLANVSANTFDVFEALQNAEAAAKELEKLGYADPQKISVDETIASWVKTAAANLTGIPFLRRFNQVAMWQRDLLSIRYASAIRKDPVAAGVLLSTQASLDKALANLKHEADRVAEELERTWLSYFPPPSDSTEIKTPEKTPDFEAFAERMRSVDTSLMGIRERCNARLGSGDPMTDLFAELEKIEVEGDALNLPIYGARTRLEKLYLLGHAGRAAEMIPLAQDARTRLLAGRVASLASFDQTFEQAAYLETWDREASAYAMQGDFPNMLETCENVIRDFETERYRINNSYRQSALLSKVFEFYMWAALSAFKLKRWDSMLEAIELIKARSAIHSRLLGPVDKSKDTEDDKKLAEAFDEVGEALVHDPKNPELLVRRRQLWDLLSIMRSRSNSPAELPQFTLAALQAKLADDEALIGYFWLDRVTILTVAVDRERLHAERIALSPAVLELFNEFINFVRELKSTSGSAMDKAVAKLGAALLPPFLRDFIASKKRLILSPHRALHLFPFHAARWDNDDFIATRFAVRYVPNFSSLLLPWEIRYEDRVLALAIENFADPAIPTLPNVEHDLETIRTFYQNEGVGIDVMAGSEATRARFGNLRESGELAKVRCIHFGTHGLSIFESPNEPMEAKILLQDGSLDCMDLAEFRFNAELAVLSACNSGQRALAVRESAELPGDDIFGLQSALFQAGVRCVLGTLWLVETESSSTIIKSFHRHYAATKKIEDSLQRALREYLADPATEKGVFYWAPYFLSCLGAAPQAKTAQN